MSERTLIDYLKTAYSSAAYCEEVKKFFTEHNKASYIEYHSKSGIPTRAVYLFEPYTVAVDNMALEEALRAEASQLVED